METTIEDVIRTLQDAIEAKTEHDKAYEEYDGYSWDWAGDAKIEKMGKAANAFGKTLEEYIDTRVQDALKKKSQTE